MRILIVHDYGTPTGGADLMSIGLRDELRARGHDARLFASSAAPIPVPNLADDLCLGTQTRAREALQIANPWAAWALRRTLRRFRPDVVHLGIHAIQLSPLVLPVLRDQPTLMFLVNYDRICPANTKVLPDGRACRHRPGRVCVAEGCVGRRSVVRHAAQRAMADRWEGCADLVVAPSAWVADRLRDEGVRVDAVVPNGVPDAPARPPLAGPPTVGVAGRLVAKKGVGVLLDALAEVRGTLPDARLVVAGDGPEAGALRAHAGRLGLDGHVTWHGHLDRHAMERALAPAWVQAVPSIWEEPFGLVAAEAMMRGTAVVASATGGLAEFVLPEGGGRTVPPGDPDALAAALMEVLADRDEAERRGARARDHAREGLGEDRFTDRMLALYEGLAGPRSPNAEGAPEGAPSSRV